MNAMSAMRQYQTVNTQAQVADASPHRLIQMLMEGGLSRLAQAKGAMLHGQAAQKGELISKAIGISGGLREGLDLPEVSLVAILDADKEGFLRSETSLVQTIGRAARNADGVVIMYADSITPSMERAIMETERRRGIQEAYNAANGITPRTIVKEISGMGVLEISSKDDSADKPAKRMSRAEIEQKINQLTREMREAAKILEFEHAAFLRDRIEKLRKQAERKTKL